MYLNSIKIIAQNVIKWTFQRRNELSNYYRGEDPDIILLNSTGVGDDESIKVFNYNIHQKNLYGEQHAGIAIAVRRDVQYQLLDDFQADILAVQMETGRGRVIIATTYLPPRRLYIPEAEIRRLFQKNTPVYFIGDFNARHRLWGYTNGNHRGDFIAQMMRANICSFFGPDFNTLINVTGTGKPDLVLGNRQATYHMTINEGDITSSYHNTISYKNISKPNINSNKKRDGI